MHRGRFSIGLLLGICGAFFLAGCGTKQKTVPKSLGPLIPVQGKVTLSGKPVGGGFVTFYAIDFDMKMVQPTGRIDAQGNYTLASLGEPGAPAGKYRATVYPDSGDKSIDLAVDGHYQSSQKSPLTITVADNAPAGAYDLKMVVKK